MTNICSSRTVFDIVNVFFIKGNCIFNDEKKDLVDLISSQFEFNIILNIFYFFNLIRI